MRTRTPVLLILALLGACDAATTPLTGEYESLPSDQVVLGIDHLYTSDGVRRARLQADTAYMFEDSSSTTLRVVTLEMFNDAGELTSTLTAESGNLNTDTQKTVARGDVVLVIPGPDGRTIWTEELHYDPGTKRIWSDVFTRMLMNTGTEMRAEKFTVDDQFLNFDLTGGAGTGLPLPVNRR
ncbi:MAG: LPS export ABC transporter periplasmic protein LptC [Gemmatimonadetes bacterium]|nr:LPS export ABC transporter periplasmic protein LptC [Gemmatimonadota bacterium]